MGIIEIIAALSAMAFIAVLIWISRAPEIDPPERTGRVMPTGDGKTLCPDCGGSDILMGPSGGIAQNVACDDCHSEFNILPGSPIIILDHMGKLTESRARYYGITPEEIRSRANEL